eukprot:4228456-Heterocapsa_arctica.AAC.1
MLSVIASVPGTTPTRTEQPPFAPHTSLDPYGPWHRQPSPPQPNEGASQAHDQSDLPSGSPAAAAEERPACPNDPTPLDDENRLGKWVDQGL